MESELQIPRDAAIPALWSINDCFGFKYPAAIQHSLSMSMLSKSFTCPQVVPQERISELLENILSIGREDYPGPHLVLWLNANINNRCNSILAEMDADQRGKSAVAHGKEILELFEWASHVPQGKSITLSYRLGNKQKVSVKLDNEDDWFVESCKHFFYSTGPFKNSTELLESYKGTPGRNSGKERLRVAYGVYRFLRDHAKVCSGERTSSLLHFIWVYLMEMGLEEREYTPAKTDSLNTNLGRYDESYSKKGGIGNFLFPKLPLLSFPLDYYVDMISK